MSVALKEMAKTDLEAFSKEAQQEIMRAHVLRRYELLRSVTSFMSISGASTARYSKVWEASVSLSNMISSALKDN